MKEVFRPTPELTNKAPVQYSRTGDIFMGENSGEKNPSGQNNAAEQVKTPTSQQLIAGLESMHPENWGLRESFIRGRKQLGPESIVDRLDPVAASILSIDPTGFHEDPIVNAINYLQLEARKGRVDLSTLREIREPILKDFLSPDRKISSAEATEFLSRTRDILTLAQGIKELEEEEEKKAEEGRKKAERVTEEEKLKDSEVIERLFQENMLRIEQREMTTQSQAWFEETTMINKLINLAEDLGDKDPGGKLRQRLVAQKNVRFALHDINFYARAGIKENFPHMSEAANQINTEHFYLVHALPGVAPVMRIFEEEYSKAIQQTGRITDIEVQKVRADVEKRFNTVATMYGLTEPQAKTAFRLGENLFNTKTRLAVYISRGEIPQNLEYLRTDPWSEFVRLYSAYEFEVGKWRSIPESAKDFARFLGKTAFDKILSVPDHDSSIWRTFGIIEGLNQKGYYKWGLFMRLKFAYKDKKALYGEDGKSGEDRKKMEKRADELRDEIVQDFLKGGASREEADKMGDRRVAGYWKDMQKEIDTKTHMGKTGETGEPQLKQVFREDILKEINHYMPEELARAYWGDEQLANVIKECGGAEVFGELCNELTRIREEELRDEKERVKGLSAEDREKRQDNYQNFDSKVTHLKPELRNLYARLHDFFEEIDGKDGKGRTRIQILTDEDAIIGGRKNPLYDKIWSEKDMPFEELEDTITPGFVGHKTLGRNYNDHAAAFGTLEILEELAKNPTNLENLQKLHGTFSKWLGLETEEKLIAQIAESVLKYHAQDEAFRHLMPGISNLLGWVIRGGSSPARRRLGKKGAQWDSGTLNDQINEMQAKGLLSKEKADELRQKLHIVFGFRILPLVQLFILTMVFEIIYSQGPQKK
ncbi:MAG: hypothetical protein M1268_04185 [Patescibacteria group bacterium]|nr:hypothetical protein [Patescibacteria group bacterium]